MPKNTKSLQVAKQKSKKVLKNEKRQNVKTRKSFIENNDFTRFFGASPNARRSQALFHIENDSDSLELPQSIGILIHLLF